MKRRMEMMLKLSFRPYRSEDFATCMSIFDTNCPEYLAPGERQDYAYFLRQIPDGYEVCEAEGRMLGVFGVSENASAEARLNWILVDSTVQGMGIGARIMERVVALGGASNAESIGLSTTQKVAPFFKKYGATTLATTRDGYGPGLDRVDMVLAL